MFSTLPKLPKFQEPRFSGQAIFEMYKLLWGTYGTSPPERATGFSVFLPLSLSAHGVSPSVSLIGGMASSP